MSALRLGGTTIMVKPNHLAQSYKKPAKATGNLAAILKPGEANGSIRNWERFLRQVVDANDEEFRENFLHYITSRK